MIKLTDLDDLNAAIGALRKELAALKPKKTRRYLFSINLFWPREGVYHLDAGVLAAIVGKELSKFGIKVDQQMISCGLHQNDGRAGEIEIKIENLPLPEKMTGSVN